MEISRPVVGACATTQGRAAVADNVNFTSGCSETYRLFVLTVGMKHAEGFRIAGGAGQGYNDTEAEKSVEVERNVMKKIPTAIFRSLTMLLGATPSVLRPTAPHKFRRR